MENSSQEDKQALEYMLQLLKQGNIKVFEVIELRLRHDQKAYFNSIVSFFGGTVANEAKSNDPVIEALVQPLIETLTNNNLSYYAALALGHIGEPAVLPLMQAIKSTDARIRAGVALALGQSFSSNRHLAFNSIVEATHDTDVQVRQAALQALSNFPNRLQATPQLLNTLKDSNQEVRYQAINALRGTKDVQVLEPMLVLLHDESVQIRLEAILALAELEDMRALDSLIERLKDSDKMVRAAAVGVVGKLGGKNVLDNIIPMTRDEDSSVRINAVVILGEFGDASVLPLLEEIRQKDHAASSQLATAPLPTVSQVADKAIQELKQRLQI
jgi:HEAT repeat protein